MNKSRQMKIRKATKKDLKKLLELDRKANKEIKWWSPITKSEFLKLIKKELVYIAEKDKKIIGYLNGDIKKHCIELADIFVKKKFRKKGVAKKLIKRFISGWKKSKFKEIQLMSPLRLKKFYEKLNFKPSMILMKYKLK